MSPTTLWRKICFYSSYMWRFILLRQTPPLIYGIALTDRCNLRCRGCHVANTGRRDMTWQEVTAALKDAWSRGFRELYLSGGEPLLWTDQDHTFKDVILAAKQMGFFHVHVYTNGLLGLDLPADLVWVSMDGLPGIFEQRRGSHFEQLERAIRANHHPKIAINYVIDRNTAEGIEPFLQWVQETRFPVIGVMFYFHTPYYGYDSLFLNTEERSLIIERLLRCTRARLPVLNSRAGLLALQSGKWPRRLPISAVLDVDGESLCCRAADDICTDCGYAACVELTAVQRLAPSAVLGMMRYW